MKFEDFRNRHVNDYLLVLGLGESINELNPRYYPNSIGVNDIGRKITPHYLLNVNNRSQYKGDRFKFIENSEAVYIFTHVAREQGYQRSPIIEFKIQRQPGGVEIGEDGLVPHYRCSPYVACTLAAYMGAKRIGLLGVDFTDGHFWTKDGPHRLNGELQGIDNQFGKLAAHLSTKGVELVNLSPISKLNSLPKAKLQEWI